MTHEEDVYIQTLSLFGTDPEPEWVHDILDKEHRKADPKWVRTRKPEGKPTYVS